MIPVKITLFLDRCECVLKKRLFVGNLFLLPNTKLLAKSHNKNIKMFLEIQRLNSSLKSKILFIFNHSTLSRLN